MPRCALGELRRFAAGFAARITIEGRKRHTFPLAACLTPEQAEERKTYLARMALRLREAGHADKIAKLVGTGAAARPGRPWQAVVHAVELICNGAATPATEIPTFASFAQDWTSGELARRFPDHVRQKRSSSRDEELLRLYVLPHVRDVRLDEFDLHDAEIVMASLPEVNPRTKRALAPATRRHVAQVISRVMHLAVYPGKWRPASPIPKGWLPSLPPRKAKECLYPNEDAQLLTGRSMEVGQTGPLPDVPLLRRVAYGFLAREGMRTEEMARLR